MATLEKLPLYHLTPASYYDSQPSDQPYRPAGFASEGFVHCASGASLLLQVANHYFSGLTEALLVLQIEPGRLNVPLKYEPPLAPATAGREAATWDNQILFPHIYGPINRQAIVACFALPRDLAGRWHMPESEVS
jgi:hypothetical protein